MSHHGCRTAIPRVLVALCELTAVTLICVCRIQINERDLMGRITACQQICLAYQKENHDAKIRYRNIDRELNSVRPELMKLQREKNQLIT